MNTLEERIHTNLHAAATLLPEETETVTLAEPAVSRWRGPAVAMAALVAVFVVLGGSMLLLANLTGDGDMVLSAGGSQSERFPVPEYLPVDTELVYGNYAVFDPDGPRSVAAVVARQTGSGFDDAVVVTVYDSPDVGIVGPGEQIMVGGHSAVLVENDLGTFLSWYDGQRTVAIYAPRGDRQGTLAVASVVDTTDVELFGSDAISIGTLPAGYSILADPLLLSVEPRPVVRIEGPAIDGPEPVRFVTIEVGWDPVEHAIGPDGYGDSFEVRGHDGYHTQNEIGTAIWWTETPGMTVSVFGNYPQDELLAIAEGLEFEPEAAWRDRYETDGPDFATTTAGVTASTEGSAEVATDGDGPDSPTTTATTYAPAGDQQP